VLHVTVSGELSDSSSSWVLVVVGGMIGLLDKRLERRPNVHILTSFKSRPFFEALHGPVDFNVGF